MIAAIVSFPVSPLRAQQRERASDRNGRDRGALPGGAPQMLNLDSPLNPDAASLLIQPNDGLTGGVQLASPLSGDRRLVVPDEALKNPDPATVQRRLTNAAEARPGPDAAVGPAARFTQADDRDVERRLQDAAGRLSGDRVKMQALSTTSLSELRSAAARPFAETFSSRSGPIETNAPQAATAVGTQVRRPSGLIVPQEFGENSLPLDASERAAARRLAALAPGEQRIGGVIVPKGFSITPPAEPSKLEQAVETVGAQAQLLARRSERLFARFMAGVRLLTGAKPVDPANAVVSRPETVNVIGAEPGASANRESKRLRGEEKRARYRRAGKIFTPRSTLTALYRDLLGAEGVGDNIRSILESRDLVENDGFDPSDPSFATRRQLLSMAHTKGLRRIVISALLAGMYRRSDAIEAAIDRATKAGEVDEASQVYDYIIVGTGPAGTTFANQMTRENPALKGLVVTKTGGRGDDRRRGVGDTFDLNDFFNLNSPNRPSVAGVSNSTKEGNRNNLPGAVVQVSNLDGRADPSSQSLADATVMSLASVSPPVLFGYTYVGGLPEEEARRQGLSTAGWKGAGIRLEFRNDEGAVRYLYANRVEETVGLENASFRVADNRTNELVAGAKAATNLDLMADTRLWFWQDFALRASKRNRPLKEFEGQTIVLVGADGAAGGDSWKVVAEWLLRLALEDSYGLDTAQTKLIKKIKVIGLTAKDCKEFEDAVRTRYARLGKGFQDNLLEAVDGRLATIRSASDGESRWRLTYNMNERASGAPNQDDGRGDAVILTTGYTSDAYTRYPFVREDSWGIPLSASNPLQNSDRVRNQYGEVPGVGRVIIGKQLGSYNIFFRGPAAGKSVILAAQKGVLQNEASLYATQEAVAFAAITYARSTSPAGFAPVPTTEPLTLAIDRPSALRRGERRVVPVLTRRLPTADIPYWRPEWSYYIRARIESALAEFSFTPAQSTFLAFTALEGGGIALEGDPVIAQRLAERLNRDPAFVEAMASRLSRNNRLEVAATVGARELPLVTRVESTRAKVMFAKGDLNYLTRPKQKSPPAPAAPASNAVYATVDRLVASISNYLSPRGTLRDFRAQLRAIPLPRALRRRIARDRRNEDVNVASLYLLNRFLKRPNSLDTNSFGGDFRSLGGNLSPEEAIELSNLAKVRSEVSPVGRVVEFADYESFAARVREGLKDRESGRSRPATSILAEPEAVQREITLKLYVLGRLLGFDLAGEPLKLAEQYEEFRAAIEADPRFRDGTRIGSDGKTFGSTLSVYFLARLLAKDKEDRLRLYRQFRVFAASNSSRGLSMREVETLFLLGNLVPGANPSVLRGLYSDFSEDPRLSGYSESERLSLFLVPFASRAASNAEQAVFLTPTGLIPAAPAGPPLTRDERLDIRAAQARSVIGRLASFVTTRLGKTAIAVAASSAALFALLQALGVAGTILSALGSIHFAGILDLVARGLSYLPYLAGGAFGDYATFGVGFVELIVVVAALIAAVTFPAVRIWEFIDDLRFGFGDSLSTRLGRLSRRLTAFATVAALAYVGAKAAISLAVLAFGPIIAAIASLPTLWAALTAAAAGTVGAVALIAANRSRRNLLGLFGRYVRAVNNRLDNRILVGALAAVAAAFFILSLFPAAVPAALGALFGPLASAGRSLLAILNQVPGLIDRYSSFVFDLSKAVEASLPGFIASVGGFATFFVVFVLSVAFALASAASAVYSLVRLVRPLRTDGVRRQIGASLLLGSIALAAATGGFGLGAGAQKVYGAARSLFVSAPAAQAVPAPPQIARPERPSPPLPRAERIQGPTFVPSDFAPPREPESRSSRRERLDGAR